MQVSAEVVRESSSEPEQHVVDLELGEVHLANRMYEWMIDPDVLVVSFQRTA